MIVDNGKTREKEAEWTGVGMASNDRPFEQEVRKIDKIACARERQDLRFYMIHHLLYSVTRAQAILSIFAGTRGKPSPQERSN